MIKSNSWLQVGPRNQTLCLTALPTNASWALAAWCHDHCLFQGSSTSVLFYMNNLPSPNSSMLLPQALQQASTLLVWLGLLQLKPSELTLSERSLKHLLGSWWAAPPENTCMCAVNPTSCIAILACWSQTSGIIAWSTAGRCTCMHWSLLCFEAAVGLICLLPGHTNIFLLKCLLLSKLQAPEQESYWDSLGAQLKCRGHLLFLK